MEDPFKSFYINITFEPQGDKALQQNHNFVFACPESMDFNVVMNHDILSDIQIRYVLKYNYFIKSL